MSDSVWPHRRQPTRLSHPWDSPGKNSGVGCLFLLQCMKVKSEREVAQYSSWQKDWILVCLQFCCSVVSDSATPWTAACQASLSITKSQSLLKFMFIESVMLSNHLILCYPLLLLPLVFLSIRVFCNELALCNRWPKYWSFSISPSNEYLGLIPFRIDWFDLNAVQETLKSLLQHHSSKASILQSSAFFMVQLSHPFMTTGKKHSFDYTDLCQQSNVSAF